MPLLMGNHSAFGYRSSLLKSDVGYNILTTPPLRSGKRRMHLSLVHHLHAWQHATRRDMAVYVLYHFEIKDK